MAKSLIEIATAEHRGTRYLLHLELRPVGPVMVLERWGPCENGPRWKHVSDRPVGELPPAIGIAWDAERQRPVDTAAANAAFLVWLSTPVEEPPDPREAEIAELSAEELRAYVLERARIIADQTPLGGDWDDPEDWIDPAAELAHGVVALLDGRAPAVGDRPASPAAEFVRSAAAVARAEREQPPGYRWTKHTTAEARAQDREEYLGGVIAQLYERLDAASGEIAQMELE